MLGWGFKSPAQIQQTNVPFQFLYALVIVLQIPGFFFFFYEFMLIFPKEVLMGREN